MDALPDRVPLTPLQLPEHALRVEAGARLGRGARHVAVAADDGLRKEAQQPAQERGYARPYAADPRKLFRIGVNFSSKEGTVESCRIA